MGEGGYIHVCTVNGYHRLGTFTIFFATVKFAKLQCDFVNQCRNKSTVVIFTQSC